MKLLATTYPHPDFFPPTLNAITELSNSFEQVIVTSRNISDVKPDFAANVIFMLSGKYQHIRASEQASLYKKIKSFFLYVSLLRRAINRYKPEVVVVYDPIPLFAYWLIHKLISYKPLLWYHNHDTSEISQVRKYSVSWWAAKYENRIFLNHVKIFSLPSLERKKLFPMDEFNGKFFFIPNFPAISLFGKFYEPKTIGNTVKIIFQGSIAEGHGLESIAELLDTKIEGKDLELIVKGWIRDDNFKKKLISIAERKGCLPKLKFIPFGPYSELPLITRTCHIGIGIHALNTNLHTTLAKASNKLYEYAALGLPIIVYDSPHYREHLDKYEWVFFSDATPESLKDCIGAILLNYDKLSKSANSSFMHEFNFELNFKPAMDYVIESASGIAGKEAS
ncbi:MAG TPA: glycosyltransferase [Puia sp.]|nr:glycosyltransferase [Puia sp.]